MKYLKKKNVLDLYINKSLKSGKKYKYYIYFKNIIKFYLKYMLVIYKILNINLKLTKKLINKDSLIQNCHNLIYNIKITRKKKKKLKSLNVVKLTKIENIPNEMYKLFNSITWHLKIRSYNLKLFYVIFSINNRNLKNNKIYKELLQIYYSKLNYQIKEEKKYIKKKIFLYSNTDNVNNIFLKKYNLINNMNKLNFIKFDNHFRYWSKYFKKKIIKTSKYSFKLKKLILKKKLIYTKSLINLFYLKHFLKKNYKYKNNLKKNKYVNFSNFNYLNNNNNLDEKLYTHIYVLHIYFNKLIKLNYNLKKKNNLFIKKIYNKI